MSSLSDLDNSRTSSTSTRSNQSSSYDYGSGSLGSKRPIEPRRSIRIATEQNCFTTCFAPRRRAKASPESEQKDATKDVGFLSITEIRKATGNFAANSIIGEGHFGIIYKGNLKDGTVVAVKRANKGNHNYVSNEFKNEIKTLSKVEHLNLVRCIGYLEQDGEKIIIFEYVSNGNLRDHLDGSRGAELDMGARIEIAIDVAHAITYLHSYADRPIIHRDIKASNILITEKLRAKVSDFGIAHIAPDNTDATHISTLVKGTPGYLDPDYVRTYQLTEKSDVYSFGVVLVELVTGRYPIEAQRQPKERMTSTWAIHKFKSGDSVMAMDPRVKRSPASVMAVEELLRLAHDCLSMSRKSRPSMKQCGEILWGIRRRYKEMTMDTHDNIKGRLNSASSTPKSISNHQLQ